MIVNNDAGHELVCSREASPGTGAADVRIASCRIEVSARVQSRSLWIRWLRAARWRLCPLISVRRTRQSIGGSARAAATEEPRRVSRLDRRSS